MTWNSCSNQTNSCVWVLKVGSVVYSFSSTIRADSITDGSVFKWLLLPEFSLGPEIDFEESTVYACVQGDLAYKTTPVF